MCALQPAGLVTKGTQQRRIAQLEALRTKCTSLLVYCWCAAGVQRTSSSSVLGFMPGITVMQAGEHADWCLRCTQCSMHAARLTCLHLLAVSYLLALLPACLTADKGFLGTYDSAAFPPSEALAVGPHPRDEGAQQNEPTGQATLPTSGS